MAGFKTLDTIGDVKGKRVLVRVDLNVPVADGKVTDATRIERVAPTITELSDKGAKVILLAHFGLFLLWQPVWRGERDIESRYAFLVVIVGFLLAAWNNWWLMAVWLAVLFGLMVLVRPGAGALALIWLIGSFALASGIVLIILAFGLKRHAPAA